MSIESPSERNRRIWQKPFSRYSKQSADIENLIHLTHEGFHGLILRPELFDAIFDDADEGKAKRVADAKRKADLAQKEKEKGFPLLHAHALVGAWGSLEALIEDLVESWIKYKPDITKTSPISKIKIPLGEFIQLSEDERARLIVTELQRDLKVDLKSGVTKYEPLLEAIGLGGVVDPRVKRSLFQSQQLRNVIVHRAGVVDRRLVDSCPWLGYETGDQVQIDEEVFYYCLHGMHMYALTIRNRCSAADGGRPTVVDCPGFEGALIFSP
ncbi:hypothetical protein [Actinomadura livida]|uniref:Uncharacterized protein n=1 Tax=Actinomadura livida TaxID=79909 RepID=A0A7W7IL13_9ACTN|nr:MULTISPECIES: hypothetical protein [Actinomadura]MBB4779022.1 hypothetical protein [Actinomadura catellatispora]GGU01120.1 hypothetical protein GCM10010208_25870 [Actinomadura livida]